MSPILEKIKDDNKKIISYSRILTNKMTIVAWKLFKSDKQLHLAFILYRLKRDFGFTDWEVANLTGIPRKQLNVFHQMTSKLLKSSILNTLARMDWKGQLKEWRDVPINYGNHPRLGQGYYIVKDLPAWYLETRGSKIMRSIPDIKLGSESEKEYDNMCYCEVCPIHGKKDESKID